MEMQIYWRTVLFFSSPYVRDHLRIETKDFHRIQITIDLYKAFYGILKHANIDIRLVA